MRKVLFVFGTRPEAIKLCPVIRSFRTLYSGLIQPLVCLTGQHRDLVAPVLRAFDVRPDFDLADGRARATLTASSARILAALEGVLDQTRPDLVVVQGDTTSTFCGAMAAFYGQVPVAHVEAGLRTGDRSRPFPEEAHRVLTARLAHLHFAATAQARKNLLLEGVSQAAVSVTGNTGVDAVLDVAARLADGRLRAPVPLWLDPAKKLLLATMHRRESFGAPLRNALRALAEIAQRDDVQVVLPLHPNPEVRRAAAAVNISERLMLIEPQPYVAFVDLLRRCYLVLTDSGGIQEEAPSLGKPVLVLREETERGEAVDCGSAVLCGADAGRIAAEASRLLDDRHAYVRAARPTKVFGDGSASARIAETSAAFLGARALRAAG